MLRWLPWRWIVRRAARVYGVADPLRERANGRLLPADSDSIARTLLAAVDDAAERADWSAEASRSARRFDRARCVQSVLELYRSVQRRGDGDAIDWNWWDRLLGRIEAEWELMSSKAGSAGRGLGRTHGGSP